MENIYKGHLMTPADDRARALYEELKTDSPIDAVNRLAAVLLAAERGVWEQAALLIENFDARKDASSEDFIALNRGHDEIAREMLAELCREQAAQAARGEE